LPTFCSGCSGIVILPISITQIAESTSQSHHSSTIYYILKNKSYYYCSLFNISFLCLQQCWKIYLFDYILIKIPFNTTMQFWYWLYEVVKTSLAKV
jgi:hypothetical protein